MKGLIGKVFNSVRDYAAIASIAAGTALSYDAMGQATNVNSFNLQYTNKVIAGKMSLQVKIPNTQSGVNYAIQTSKDLRTWETANTVAGQDGTTIVAYRPMSGMNDNVRVSASLAGSGLAAPESSYSEPETTCGCYYEDKSKCFTISKENENEKR